MKKFARLLLLVPVCMMAFHSLTVFAAKLPGAGKFTVGYNEPWFGQHYGTDLTTSFDRNFIAETFDGMAKGGASIVRIWLFGNLQGIELGTAAPQTVGLSSDYAANLNSVLELARRRDLKVYVTMLNSTDLWSARGARRDYFWNLLANKNGEGDAFRSKVLAPVLGLLNANRDIIYGLDLMNEIEGAIVSGYFPGFWLGARHWIRGMAAFVKAESPWLPVTSSAGWGWGIPEIIFGFYSGLGLSFYDVHIYADSGRYFGAEGLCLRAASDRVPIILGEFGQHTKTANDQLQSVLTTKFLTNAKNSCFSAALAWKFESADYFTYRNADGSFRPAYGVVRDFGVPH